MNLALNDQACRYSDPAAAPEQPPGAAALPAPEAGTLPDEAAKPLAELFKLLADETRLRILFLLQRQRELNVRGLCQLLEQSQPAVSHHLALLRVSGLIEMRRDGKHNFYRLLPERIAEMMETLFQSVPGESNQIRFDDHILSYSPATRRG